MNINDKLNINVPVITIDGPSGTGKGTITKLLAQHLQWNYLDSGVLYRVLGLAAKKRNIAIEESRQLIDLALNLDITFVTGYDGSLAIYLDNENVSQEIRQEQCAQDASKTGAILSVREALLERQRQFRKSPGLVTDGRDMGTVVFPDAILKLYLDATLKARAERRFLQLKSEGFIDSLESIYTELETRDIRDKQREYSPLRPAEQAIIIDTTNISIDEVFQQILQLIKILDL